MLHNPLSPKGRVMAKMDHVATARFADVILRIGRLRIGEDFARLQEIDKPKAYRIWQRQIPAEVKTAIYGLILEEFPDPENPAHTDEILLAAQGAAGFVAESLSSSFAIYGNPVDFIRKENIGKLTAIVSSIEFSIEFTSMRKMPFLILPKIPLKDEIAILRRKREQVMARIATNMYRLADILLGKHSMARMENDYFMFRSAGNPCECLQVIIDPNQPRVSANYITRNTAPLSVDLTDIVSDPEKMAEKITESVSLYEAASESCGQAVCRP